MNPIAPNPQRPSPEAIQHALKLAQSLGIQLLPGR